MSGSVPVNSLSNTILLVEDNEDDVFALQRAIRNAEVGNPLRVATDGRQALAYLAAAGAVATRAQYPLPFLVLLDLKLPYRDGFQVLEWIRTQKHLNEVVVVMLTGSDEARDHQRAYSLGARSYLVKPASADDLKRLLDSLHSYWSKSGTTPVITSARDTAGPTASGTSRS